jgi:hypothetical protein
MDRSSLLRALQDRVEATARRLEDDLSGATACTLQRDGRVTGGVKYHEGRLVSYRALARTLGETPDDRVPEVLAEHAARWRADLERHAGRGATQWAAYATGGLDAATEACCLSDAPCGTR